MDIDKLAIRKRALLLAQAGSKNIVATLTGEFGISRQAINAHLAQMVKAGDLVPFGSTKARIYKLGIKRQAVHSFVRRGLNEDDVWRSLCAPIVKDLPENVRGIWHYGITEMVNNAIDHSSAETITVVMEQTALNTMGSVSDDGEGIFLKIQRALGLFDAREGILELAKGKLTTDPANHTGEGIFFASKMFDGFHIVSGHLTLTHGLAESDFLLENANDHPGTQVLMTLENDSRLTIKAVFDKFAAPDEYTFDRTVVPVRLAQYEGETLISRSQAKRLTARFEKFRTVMLDFTGVESIGQAFADEVFRVFATAHPQIELIPTETTPAVESMIRRALADARAGRS